MEKKALTSKREGRGWVVRGGKPGLQPLSALLAQLSRGRYVGRGEERARGTGRYWKPILQDNQGCWAGWDHLAIVRSDHWACTSWPCPKRASGFWPGSSSTLPRSWRSQSTAVSPPGWRTRTLASGPPGPLASSSSLSAKSSKLPTSLGFMLMRLARLCMSSSLGVRDQG